jgi:uncharacterized iron-regulated protein
MGPFSHASDGVALTDALSANKVPRARRRGAEIDNLIYAREECLVHRVVFTWMVVMSVVMPQLAAAQTQSLARGAPATHGYVPERVYDTRKSAFADFEVMLAEFAGADVVLIGEQHDDPNTHRLEAAVLEGLLRRSAPAIVSLEMFERDVQGALGEYLAGKIDEDVFLKLARPWPRYVTDYRPLVELAKARNWPVIAANVPRKYASLVAKSGLAALDELPGADRALIARDLQCPLDAYFDRFAETMNSHPGPVAEKLTAPERRATTERYYFSQCVKDETMAESIAEAVQRQGRSGPVVHYNGAFHTDFGAGAAERVRRRLPGRRVIVATVLPVQDLDAIAPSSDDLERADYLIYTIK